VSDSPPGRAIALYKQGALGTRYLGTRQVVVVGADGRTYRRLDAAESRGVVGADGEFEPADGLLAPDGGSVALAESERVTGAIDVVDLRTGKVRGYRLDPPGSTHPLAWSADGRRLAVVLNDAPLAASEDPREIAILDVTTGAVNRLALSRMSSWGFAAAFAPDGMRLAVTVDVGEASPSSEQAVAIIDLAGTVLHTIAMPRWHTIAGPAAWSPDGALLVTVRHMDGASTLTFLDATGEDRAVPAPRSLAGPWLDLLGWRSPDTLLIGIDGSRDYRIAETPLRGGEPRTVSRLPQGIGNLASVGRLQLAGALVGTATITDAGGVERGPWPWWWRITLAVLILLVAWTLWRRFRSTGTRVHGAGEVDPQRVHRTGSGDEQVVAPRPAERQVGDDLR
jgi:hypothetical protein